ncbi:YhgE/Pip family protein [Peribacillus sp. NPDC096379]|uniref:YhgE/Pip domain-containing protein n=1 Tax=Peribacillus sp. NPDC096379 TaxID=3364393 RepID=UPI003811A782
MKNIWEIFRDDIRSITRNRVASVLVIGLMLLPSIYAWFNIKASWDPYSNTAGIFVGVANNDTGTSLNGKSVNLGNEIIESLKGNTSLGWKFTDEKNAIAKVETGEYYATIIIPANFSKNITTVLTDIPVKPEIHYYVNEKINAIAPKMTQKGASTIVENVSENFVKEASGSIFAIFNELGIELEKDLPAIDNVKKMVYWLEQKLPILETTTKNVQSDLTKAQKVVQLANEGLIKIKGITATGEDFASGVDQYANSAQTAMNKLDPLIKQDLETIQADGLFVSDKLNRLKDPNLSTDQVIALVNQAKARLDKTEVVMQGIQDLLKGLNEFSDNNLLQAEIDAVSNHLENIKQQRQVLAKMIETNNLAEQTVDQLTNLTMQNKGIVDGLINNYPNVTLPKFKEAFSRVDSILTDARSMIEKGKLALPKVEGTLHDASRILTTSKVELTMLQKRFPKLENEITALADKLRTFEKGHDIKEIIDLLRNNSSQESDFFAKPVLLKEHSLFPIPNYGSAMSPFYTTLSLWVGATLLISMMNVNISGDYKPTNVYLGRLLTFLIIGMIQALIVSVGDIFLIGTYVAEKLWFILFSIIISAIFVLITYTFVSVLGSVGKALCVLLLVLQVTSSGGTFPVQVAPTFFQKINPYLLFTYGISLLREAVGGILWSVVYRDLLVLIIYAICILIFGLLLKKPLHRFGKKIKEKMRQCRVLEE